MQKVKIYLPGCLVCIIITILAQCIANILPSVGAALFAIGIGMFAGNTFLNKSYYNQGTKFSESKLLEYSIVLTGLTLQLTDIAGVGLSGIIFIILQMCATITCCYIIGKALGFTKRFSLLMCAGNAVCGSSAIGTVSPILHADSKDKGISITIVNVTGTLLMILLPLITSILYHHEPLQTSAMVGGILQSIGQVIASASMISVEVVDLATIFKIIRIICIVFVALVFSHMDVEENNPLFAKHPQQTAIIKARIPWFVIGFFLFSILNSSGLIPTNLSHAAKAISSQFEIIALAAIGMRVKFKDLLHEGPKAMLYGCITGSCQLLFAFLLIALLIHA